MKRSDAFDQGGEFRGTGSSLRLREVLFEIPPRQEETIVECRVAQRNEILFILRFLQECIGEALVQIEKHIVLKRNGLRNIAHATELDDGVHTHARGQDQEENIPHHQSEKDARSHDRSIDMLR